MESREGRIEKLLRRADAAMLDGIKKADRVLDEAVSIGTITAKQASKTSKDIHARAKKERDALLERGTRGVSAGIETAKRARSSASDDLEVLERLGKLRKSKVITEKEFQAKKKKILERI